MYVNTTTQVIIADVSVLKISNCCLYPPIQTFNFSKPSQKYLYRSALKHSHPVNHHNHYIHRPALTQLTPTNLHNHYFHCPAPTHLNKSTPNQSVANPVSSQTNSDMTNDLSSSVANTLLSKNSQPLTAANVTQCANSSVRFRLNLAADSGKQHSKSQMTCVNIQPVSIIISIQCAHKLCSVQCPDPAQLTEPQEVKLRVSTGLRNQTTTLL